MGRYTTFDRVTRRYPDASKGISGEVMEPEYIAPAEDELDGRLALRYQTPFSAIPSLAPATIADLATDMAYYKAVGIRNNNGKNILAAIEARLQRLIAGVEKIATNGGVLSPISTGGGWSSTSDFTSSFGMDDPTNWVVSSAWQQASENARNG